MKRLLVLFLALVMALTCVSFAAAEEEPVELVFYTLGNTTEHDPEIMEYINAVMLEKFNCKLVLHKNTNNDHLEKLQMLVAANESFDIAFVSNQYANYVAMEAFYPLKGLLEEYGQDILAVYPQALWDAVTIGGEIYAVPVHKYSCSHYYYAISITQATAAGVDCAWVYDETLDRDEKWEAFKGWCYDMKEAGADINGYVTSITQDAFNALYPMEAMTGSEKDPGVVILGTNSFANQEANVVFNQFATPEFAAFCADARELYLAGITPIDNTTKVTMAAGDPAVCVQDSMAKRLAGYEATYSQDFEPYFVNYAFTTTAKIYGSMNAISANSKHPELAMQFINEMIGNTEFANLIFYGVEGISYNRNEEGRIVVDKNVWNNTLAWSLPGFCTAEPDTSLPANMVEMYLAFNEVLQYADNVGFAFDETNILTELAAIRQATAEYLEPLCKGMIDPEENLPLFLKALDDAGVDKVIAEEQAQLDAWREIQGK